MRIGTLFSGIGSPEQGAKRVYDDLELVFACEWDKYARESFNANYEIAPEHFHKDIADMDGKQYRGKVDIIIGGSPCQDFSLAGLRAGINGNKGVLIYEYIRIIDEVQPPIFIYENVKGMLSDQGGKTIREFIEAFRLMGYDCHYDVLNTKDYGVPQNRERIFLVGFKDTEHYHRFAFADKIKLEKRLKDILEDDVDEKYYLKDKTAEKFEFVDMEGNQIGKIGGEVSKKHNSITNRIFDVNKLAPTLTTASTGGNQEVKILDYTNSFNEENTREYDKYSPTLRADRSGLGVDTGYKIRKLTPREYFRLQDFPDSFKFVVSNSQLYKQAGNSISVNVMEMIFRQIEKSRHESCLGGLFI